MGFKRFGLLLGLRLAGLLLAIATTAFLLISTGYPTAVLLMLTGSVMLALETVRFVSRTNRELARFLDAVRYADFGQRFEFPGLGAGFQELGKTFTEILDRFRASRSEQEGELRHLKAILEHVPVPLISLHADQRISLWNNAARRLFAGHSINRLEDLKVYGSDLPARISSIQPGDRLLVGMDADNMHQTLTLSASEILTSGQTERLISLQNIQNELDGMQLQAWQDLVRVLTHEIMNSVTPVSSLAKTASVLIQDVRQKIDTESELVDELNDIKDAVDTVARRSDGLMGFVESYQRLMRLPEPDRSRFRITELFADVTRIATVDWPSLGIALEQHTEPEQLNVLADRQMLEQVLINLLQNAEHALADQAGGRVILSAALNPRGQVTIEVADNGPGIPAEIAARMFVPFYTTRSDGSGVGLALSRQVMNAHGGTISYVEGGSSILAQSTGARFTLAF